MKEQLIIIMIVFACTLQHLSYGQTTFQRTLTGPDNDQAREIKKTNDGGYILTGLTKSYGAGDQDVFVLKLDSDGNKLWDKTFGGGTSDRGYSIISTLDSGFVIVGTATSFSGNSDVYVIKLDNTGSLQWENTYGGSNEDDGYGITQLPDSSYFVVGVTRSYGTGNRDIYLLKIDKVGNLTFTKTYGGAADDWCKSFLLTTNNELIIIGHTLSFGAGNMDGYILKVDLNGNLLWTKVYGSTGQDWFMSVKEDNNGDYIIGGFTDSGGAGMLDAWLVKTDTTGTIEFSNTYGSNLNEDIWEVTPTTDNGYALVGNTAIYNSAGDFMLLKTDSLGNQEWAMTYGSNNVSVGLSMEEITTGYVIAGYEVINLEDIYLIQTTKIGKSSCLDTLVTLLQGTFSPFLITGGSVSTGGAASLPTSNVTSTTIAEDTLCFDVCAMISIATGDSLLCFGDSDGSSTVISSNGTSPYQYSWNDTSSQTTATAIGLSGGTYLVTVTDQIGCTTIDSVLIYEPPAISVSLSTTPSNTGGQLCSGTITANVTGGTPSYSYQWDSNANNQTTQTADSLCEGTYCVTITDDNGCALDTCSTVTVGIKENYNTLAFNLFPNPSNGLLTIELKFQGQDEIAIEITDLLGRKVFKNSTTTDRIRTLDLSALDKGHYNLTIKTTALKGTEKLVIK